jgi:hypothetical protein
MSTNKKPSAKQIAARKKFAEIMKSGGFKKTAKKRSKNPIAREGISAKAYVKRPSQITRKTPTKRLTKRRVTHLENGQPEGYFPNPILKRPVYIVLGIDKRGTYLIKAYENLNEAKFYAHECAEKEPLMTIRVVSLKIN